MGNARPIEGRPQSEVQVGPDKLNVVVAGQLCLKSSRHVSQVGLGSTLPGVDSIVTFEKQMLLINENIFSNLQTLQLSS